MLKKITTIFSTIIILLTLLTANIFACACCAEPGFYNEWKGKTDKFYLDVLSQMKFAQESDLYMTEAGWEMIKGLDSVNKNYPIETWVSSPLVFNSSHSFMNLKNSDFSINYWKINFTTKHKKLKGSIILPVPEKMSSFKVDIRDNKDGGAGSPLLYKELRFKGKVKNGNGFVEDGIDNSTNFKLVFQGRGNGCDNASDFTHWRLAIKGEKSDYQFFGKMSSGVKKDGKDLVKP